MAQIARNRESTTRQYDLVARAVELGWPRAAVGVIDEDLGVSAASATGRSGFAELATQVGAQRVGGRVEKTDGGVRSVVPQQNLHHRAEFTLGSKRHAQSVLTVLTDTRYATRPSF
jgi:hypothetical protein